MHFPIEFQIASKIEFKTCPKCKIYARRILPLCAYTMDCIRELQSFIHNPPSILKTSRQVLRLAIPGSLIFIEKGEEGSLITREEGGLMQ